MAARLREAHWIPLGVAAWVAGSCVVTPLFMVGAASSPLEVAVALSVVADVTEESLRYALARTFAALRDPTSRAAALVVGLAHGTTEALVFGLRRDPSVLAAASRPVLVLGHVAFAAIVWRAAARGEPRWLALAVMMHIGIDLLGFALPLLAPGTDGLFLLPALLLAGFAIAELRASR